MHLHIMSYVLRDLIRNRWFFVYAAFFFLLTTGLFQLQGAEAKVSVGLLSACLFLLPLLSSLFGIIYFYNAREFVELILTQPLQRKSVFFGMLMGLGFGMFAGFLLGIAIPHLLYGAVNSSSISSLVILVTVGGVLSLIFLAIALYIAVRFDDRGKGLAATLGFWLFAALIYDGLMLAGAMLFSGYPLELPLLGASALNPIDLARVLLLFETDWAALMGYTGAVFQKTLGTGVGIGVAMLLLLSWIAMPTLLGARNFQRKDF